MFEHIRGAWRERKAQRQPWLDAQSLGELRELTAEWLLREPAYHPGYPNVGAVGPDPETDLIATRLAAANQAGFLTHHSQPGETWTRDGQQYSQHAQVGGYCDDPGVLTDLVSAALKSGLRVDVHDAASGERKAPPLPGLDSSACWHRRPGRTIPGHIVLRECAPACGDDAQDQVLDAWQVCIADPEPGRADRFDAALDEFGGRKAPEGEEAAVLPQSERAKGVEARTHGWDGKPLSEADKRFFALRDSGFTGWIDQDGNKAPCPSCGQQDCTAGLTERCNGAESPQRTDRATSTAVQGGTSRAIAGGTMSVDLDLPTANAADASTPETLARALRDTADNARRSAVDKDAQAESLRAQAAAMDDKPDMADSAQALLNEAARLAEVAEARRGMASAYEDKAAQVDAQRAK